MKAAVGLVSFAVLILVGLQAYYSIQAHRKPCTCK